VNILQLSQSNAIATSSSETGAMNGTDQDAALGRLVREHREMKRRADEIAHTINNIGERLAALGVAMRVQNTQVASPSRLASILSELPADLTPARIRDMIAEYSAVFAQLSAIKSDLKPYGLGD
jgi:hypothetical protein